MKGNRGDYVVTEQAGTYTVLIVRMISAEYLMLEEIDTPTLNHDPDKQSWKEWISKEAPGHTAWVSYLIDLEKNRLVESYSHSRKAWTYADDPNHFLARLLTLSLEKTPQDKRKRIGAPPSENEQDRRSFWTPSIVFEGKKIEKPSITAWSAKWPHDGSMIADCEIELYFSQFPFPYWIEVKSPHYKASLRTIDSGHGMTSPKPIVLQQSPFFIGGNHRKPDGLEIHLHLPKYYSEFRLLAIDLLEEGKPPLDLLESQTKWGEITLHIPETALETKLKKGHRYRLLLTSKAYPHIVIYSDSSFHW